MDVSRISLQWFPLKGALRNIPPSRTLQRLDFSFRDPSQISFSLTDTFLIFLQGRFKEIFFQGSFKHFPSSCYFLGARPLMWSETRGLALLWTLASYITSTTRVPTWIRSRIWTPGCQDKSCHNIEVANSLPRATIEVPNSTRYRKSCYILEESPKQLVYIMYEPDPPRSYFRRRQSHQKSQSTWTV